MSTKSFSFGKSERRRQISSGTNQLVDSGLLSELVDLTNAEVVAQFRAWQGDLASLQKLATAKFSARNV
jgi:hypothetical protein